jgi:hypothetical protein
VPILPIGCMLVNASSAGALPRVTRSTIGVWITPGQTA